MTEKITGFFSSLQGISLLVIIISALIFVLFERLYPYTKGQKVFREGFFNDFVLYSIVQSYVLGLIIFAFLNYIKSHTSLYDYSILSKLPVMGQLVILLLIHDFYIYWFHKWMHHNKYLWRIHEAHHSTKDVDWLSGSRSHSLEILINQTIEFAPIILLGASPEIAVYKGMISAIWGMFIHCNIDIRLGKLQYIVNGPEMHRWHHSDDGGREFQNNYSTKFAFWDWIFGTAFFPDPGKRKPLKYGLSDTPDFPSNYFMQHIFAFRKFNSKK
jgi:sterol desaturase/sphingolipid hydroxylase (fatty acid hydroxylase superfamily)